MGSNVIRFTPKPKPVQVGDMSFDAALKLINRLGPKVSDANRMIHVNPSLWYTSEAAEANADLCSLIQFSTRTASAQIDRAMEPLRKPKGTVHYLNKA